MPPPTSKVQCPRCANNALKLTISKHPQAAMGFFAALVCPRCTRRVNAAGQTEPAAQAKAELRFREDPDYAGNTEWKK